MKTFRPQINILMLAVFSLQALLSPVAYADFELSSIANALSGLRRPKSSCEPSAEDLAKQIDRLEYEIETYGSVVPKQPDVWGEARMTKHRQDVERILQERLDDFEVTLNAAVRRSDQSFFATAAALNAAVLADSDGDGPKTALETSIDLLPDANVAGQDIIDRTGNEAIDLKNFGEDAAIGLEPTIVLDQLNRYLGHLNELRRINEGDDTSDSPGYAMNLVRIPVSVLPGKKTREGYGADVTFTATPHLTDELLPSTFRNLLVNDVVDQLALPLAQFYNNDRDNTDTRVRLMKRSEEVAHEGLAALDTWIETIRIRAKQQYEQDQYELQQIKEQKGALTKEDLEDRFTLQHIEEIETYLQRFRIGKHYYWDRLFELDYLARQIGEKITPSNAATGVKKTLYLDKYIQPYITRLLRNPLLPDAARASLEASKKGLTQPLHIDIDYLHLANATASVIRTGKAELRANIRFSLLENQPTPVDLSINWIQEPKSFFKWVKSIKKQDNMTFPLELNGLTIALDDQDLETTLKSLPQEVRYRISEAAIEAFIGQYRGLFSDSLDEYYQDNSQSLGGGTTSLRSRRARLPLPPSQMSVVYGWSHLGQIATNIHATTTRNPVALSDAPIAKKHIHLIDIRRTLADEIDAAYNLLSLPESYSLWGFANSDLTRAIRERDLYSINEIRTNFTNALPQRHPERDELKHSVTSALAWGIIVEAAFLNEQLLEDLQRVAREKACGCFVEGPLKFFLPKPPVAKDEYTQVPDQWRADFADASQAFIKYVRCRWPIHVFALDPAVQEQNVADIFNVRREMQMSLAVGVALGEISAGQAQKHARRMELDMETIDLNRTIVGYSHGTDTFGWRFYPRVQAGDPTCYPCTIANTFSGRTLQRDHLIKQRRLEPGMRECVAVVLMPSFVPHVHFESRGSWFKLTNPRHKELTLKDSLRISRDYQCVQQALHCVCDSNCYRPGDVAQLSGVVQQIERRLPLQNTLVQVPHENRLGGFEMFDTGLTDLSPELLGWYGAPGVKVGGKDDQCENNGVNYINENQCKFTCKGTTLFLVGSKFSVHETKVIAGGKCVPFTLLSRDIMRVTIDSNANPLTHDGKLYVDVHVATPYGVTNHLLIPAFKETEEKKDDEDLKKEVEKLKENLVQIEFDPAKNKLVYDVTCKDENPIDLQFQLRNSNDRIPFSYKSLSTGVQDKTAKLMMALYSNGSYFNSLLPVKIVGAPTGEILLDNFASPTILASSLDSQINSLLEQYVRQADFKDNKHKLSCRFYLEIPPGADVPVPVLGSLPVELNLKCECCSEKESETVTVTPKEEEKPEPETIQRPEAEAEAEAPTLLDPQTGSANKQTSSNDPCDCSTVRVVPDSFVR